MDQAAMVALKRGMASLAAVHASLPPHRGLREDGDPMATQKMVKLFPWVENAGTSPHGEVGGMGGPCACPMGGGVKHPLRWWTCKDERGAGEQKIMEVKGLARMSQGQVS